MARRDVQPAPPCSRWWQLGFFIVGVDPPAVPALAGDDLVGLALTAPPVLVGLAPPHGRCRDHLQEMTGDSDADFGVPVAGVLGVREPVDVGSRLLADLLQVRPHSE